MMVHNYGLDGVGWGVDRSLIKTFLLLGDLDFRFASPVILIYINHTHLGPLQVFELS